MRQRMFLGSSIAALPLLASIVWGAPGDEIARIVPPTCVVVAQGLAFDGEFLYYSQFGDPVSGTVYMIEAATSVERGSFVANESGTPIQMGGLAWDPNRELLWGGGDNRFHRIDPATGSILMSFPSVESFGIEALAYDPFLDTLWEADGGRTNTTCYRGNGALCGQRNVSLIDRGLTSDGVDMWSIAGDRHLPEMPDRGFIFPSGIVSPVKDFSRAFDIPGFNYRDAAYDCVTFDVPAVWVALGFLTCDLIAYEVASRAPSCIQAPGRHIVRAWSNEADPAAWRSLLPLTTAKSVRTWRAPSPLYFVDEGPRGPEWDNPPFVVYRVLGPGDADQGNILKLIKGVGLDAFILSE